MISFLLYSSIITVLLTEIFYFVYNRCSISEERASKYYTSMGARVIDKNTDNFSTADNRAQNC